MIFERNTGYDRDLDQSGIRTPDGRQCGHCKRGHLNHFVAFSFLRNDNKPSVVTVQIHLPPPFSPDYKITILLPVHSLCEINNKFSYFHKLKLATCRLCMCLLQCIAFLSNYIDNNHCLIHNIVTSNASKASSNGIFIDTI